MNNIKELRVELGISQRALAKAVGVSDSTISSWENGKQPSAEYQDKATAALTALLQLRKRLGIPDGVRN